MGSGMSLRSPNRTAARSLRRPIEALRPVLLTRPGAAASWRLLEGLAPGGGYLLDERHQRRRDVPGAGEGPDLHHVVIAHPARVAAGPFNGLLLRRHLQYVEAADELLRLRVGAVPHAGLAVLEDDVRARGRAQALGCDEHAGLVHLLVVFHLRDEDGLVEGGVRGRGLRRGGAGDEHEAHAGDSWGGDVRRGSIP